MDIQHALITGGAGFIGSHIAEKLIEEGLKVTIIDNLSVGSQENIPDKAIFIKGDIRDKELMEKVMDGIDIVFHEAAKVSIRASFDQCYEDAETNLMGTINVLRAAIKAGVKKVIFASSMAVYADSEKPVPVPEDGLKKPLSPYGIAKLASERYCLVMCREAGIDCVVLRYFNTFGPRQTFTPYVGVITIFINRLLAGKSPVIFGDGSQLRDFVHVQDIARANILAMNSPATGEIINIGTGRGTTVNEVTKLLISRINPEIKQVYEAERPGELKISFPDISKATRLLGYQPQWTLEEKIEEVIDFIRSGGKAP
jgi:nucleoside-diphosphate-sugar epimerase